MSSIAPGAACTIHVSFTPSAAGMTAGTLTINDNAETQSVGLSGTGTSATLTVNVSPAGLLFPEQLLNTKNPYQLITITNTGSTPVSNIGVKVAGDFIEGTNCTASLGGAGTKCYVVVYFKPTAAGTRTGTLSIILSTVRKQTVSLTGTGSTGSLSGALSVSPSVLTFSGYTIGDNPSQVVTVTNTSGASAGVLEIIVKGDSSLTQLNKCPAVLAPGATCAIAVTFRPVAYGTSYSTLIVVEASGAVDRIPITAESGPSI